METQLNKPGFVQYFQTLLDLTLEFQFANTKLMRLIQQFGCSLVSGFT